MFKTRRVGTFLLALAAACGDNDAVPTPDASVPPQDTEHAGGAVGPVVLAGSRLYQAVGAEVQIWDVTDPTRPQLLGTTPPVPAVVQALALSGQHLFVGEAINLDSRVHVIDVADPAAPQLVKTFRAAADGQPSVVRGFALEGTTLYVADWEQGVIMIDVSDVRAPRHLARYAASGLTAVHLANGRIYATGTSFTGTGVTVLDRDLTPLGSFVLSGATAIAPTAAGLVASTGTHAAQILDVADPSSPLERFYDEELRAFTVEAAGTTAWYAADGGIVTIDVADPDLPSFHLLHDDRIVRARQSDASSSVLAVGSERGRVVLLDVRAPQTPSVASAIDVSACTDCIAAFPVGDHLLVADSSAGLRSLVRRDLTLVGHATRDRHIDFEDVAVSGSYAFVADWFYGLRVFDIADPARLLEVSSLFTGGYPAAIAIAGDRAVIGESTEIGAIVVVDIADPRAPRTLGRASTSKSRDVAVAGDHVYVADEGMVDSPGGLRIFDIRNPSQIVQLAHVTTCSAAIGVAVRGTVAALACDQQGLLLLDITRPAAPVPLAALDLTDETDAAHAVAIDGDRVYLGTTLGVQVIDISDPTHPQRVSTHPTAWSVRGITVREPGHVVVAAGLGGVYQWRL